MRTLGPIKADNNAGAGAPPPTRELLENLGRFIEEVTNAGELLAAEGFQTSFEGWPRGFDY
jgi:hypothetical protein